jgi:hypothetical protein
MSSFANSNTNSSTKKVIEYTDWNPLSHKYMAPKVNDKGGKSIMLISEQTKRSLHLNTPLLMTWGIADFCDEQGHSDGKYKMSLNFPNPEYKTKSSEDFLERMIKFQERIIEDAVENSELWFGKKKSKELVEDSFFPFLKYPKDKVSKLPDMTRAPSFNVKVPCYNEKWDVELYDTNYNTIYPCEDTSLTPTDFVPKMSKVACTIQCTGVWIGGKGWGLTWKLIQAVVKPKESETIRGKCQIRLSDNDKSMIETQEVELEDPDVDDIPAPVKAPIDTSVEDSDDETAEPQKPQVKNEPEVQVSEGPKVVKKVIKKKVAA